MKPTLYSFLTLAMIVGFSTHFAHSADSTHQDKKNAYEDWKNKPSVPFSDAENNFNQVKKTLLERHLNSKITNEMLFEAATRGMLQSLNPDDGEEWNKLYSPSEYEEFQMDASGEVTGIGIAIQYHDETQTASIIGVIPHSAAETAGIRIGDQLVSVNGKISKGLQFRDIVYSIRGPVGGTVKLKLLRGDELITKKVAREKINWSSVDAAELPGEVALIRISYFNEKSSSDIKDALDKMKSHPSKGLILDLRENEGGLFEQAVQSAGLFVDIGRPVARLLSRDGKEEILKSRFSSRLSGVPIYVLVSEKTSSGAELLAASVAENTHAKIVGTKTHGKWSAQTLEMLNNGFAYKFTTSEFQSPLGKSYAGTGITPDISLAASKEIPHDYGKPSALLTKDEALRSVFDLISKN